MTYSGCRPLEVPPLAAWARARRRGTVMSEAKRQKSDDPPYDGGDGDGDDDDGDDGDDDEEDKGENGEEDPPLPAPSDAPGADLSKVPNFRPTVTLFPPRALPPTLT